MLASLPSVHDLHVIGVEAAIGTEQYQCFELRLGDEHPIAIAVVNNVVVARVTSTIRNIPTCIPVGADEGIGHDSVATFDNLAAVPKSILTKRLGQLGVDGHQQMCAALDAMADC